MVTESIKRRIDLRVKKNLELYHTINKAIEEYNRNATEITNLYKKGGETNTYNKCECWAWGRN